MMSMKLNVRTFQRKGLNNMLPIPYVSTLDDIGLEITEGTYPYITFKTLSETGDIISCITIPKCRFRICEHDESLIEARSCDCGEGTTICGFPMQKIALARSQLRRWVLADTINPDHFLFVCQA